LGARVNTGDSNPLLALQKDLKKPIIVVGHYLDEALDRFRRPARPDGDEIYRALLQQRPMGRPPRRTNGGDVNDGASGLAIFLLTFPVRVHDRHPASRRRRPHGWFPAIPKRRRPSVS
jgi:hypothetical protein